MSFGYLKFVVAFALLERIWSLPLACPYNGTSYKEGESVTTEEPCLSCICQKGALECSLKVCADYPNVLPPGCFLVHKPNDCCPQLLCEESFDPAGIELRTDFKFQGKPNGNDCVINGSTYAEGSALASPHPCEYCYCVEGKTKCVKPRCLQSFEGCKAIYEKSSCCPTHYDCRDADVNLLRTQIRNYVSANFDSNISTNFVRSLPDSEAENDNFDASEGDSTEKAEESTTVTTEEVSTQETTVTWESESTTISEQQPTTEESRPTTLSFQTAKTEESIKESTTPSNQEETTQQPAEVTTTFQPIQDESKQTTDVLVRNKLNFTEPMESSSPVEGSRDNSSHEVDDYDTYDYSEPQLPPSLPNLVIFPFVAADAVVKADAPEFPDTYDKVQTKRIDSHPVIYKDLFSPSIKTEGGFVPKEPFPSSEPFYEYVYYRKEQIEPPVQGNRGSVCQEIGCSLPKPGFWEEDDSQDQRHRGSCHYLPRAQTGVIKTANLKKESWDLLGNTLRETDFAGFADKQKKVAVSDLTATPHPFAAMSTEFIFKDKIHQTKKPVTVTYKNVVVDFYPSYLITTTRYHPKIQSVETTRGDILNPISETPGFEETSPKTFPATAETTAVTTIEAIPSIRTTTIQSSFLDELFKSFLSEEIISTTTVTNTKHKYSSKIKGQPTTTAKPFNRKPELEKYKPEITTDKFKAQNGTRKPIKKEGIKSFPKKPFGHLPGQEEKPNEKAEPPDSVANESFSRETKTPETETEEGGGHRGKHNEGALLKLAGCNIYGMMYRVGKVITELSGPCLECLCTDLGVQCRPLKC